MNSDYPGPDRAAFPHPFQADRALTRSIVRQDPVFFDRHGEALAAFGQWITGPLESQAVYTDRFAPPRLERYAADGDDRWALIENASYSAAHAAAYAHGTISKAYEDRTADDRPRHLVSFVMGYGLSQADISVHCPVTLTGAVAHVLNNHGSSALTEDYRQRLCGSGAGAATGGTWATEREGGSDLGATASRARPLGDGSWRLEGLKWFVSNAGCDVALATARPIGAPEGLTGLGCYLVPARLPDGSRNLYILRRLKDKLGTRGLPTGEIDLNGARAFEIAPPPQGAKVMLAALGYSRVHNAMAAAGVQRRCLMEAARWARQRRAFGRTLWDYPMVRGQLADMTCHWRASLALATEAAAAFDSASSDHGQLAWMRMATACAKKETADQAVAAARRTVELLGGNGYVEDWPAARLLRDSLVLPVWEGPGNIQALELARLIAPPVKATSVVESRLEALLSQAPASLGSSADTVRAAAVRALEICRELEGRPDLAPILADHAMTRLAPVLAAAALLATCAGPGPDAAVAAAVARRYCACHLQIDTPDPRNIDPDGQVPDEVLADSAEAGDD